MLTLVYAGKQFSKLTSGLNLYCAWCRSKSGRLARYNIHELVMGKATQAQKQLLHEGYARAGDLEHRITDLKACLVKE